MTHSAPAWIDALPRNSLVAELSIWSADLVRLAEDLARLGPHVDMLHVDVADGHFAPAMLFFPDLVAAVRRLSTLPLHVHLMVADAIVVSQVEQFADAGADLISLHVENDAVADAALDAIALRGRAAGMVLKVDTPVGSIRRYVSRLDFVTLLGTRIGVKGQDLDPAATSRLQEARAIIRGSGATHRIVLAADGGIREHTVPLLRSAGAETVVLGSLATQAKSLEERMAWLRAL